MSLQVIKSPRGKAEYVLLPIAVYQTLRAEINKKLALQPKENDYVLFKPEDYIDNPVALARINANLTQAELAKRLQVSQAYISKLEKQATVTAKMLKRIEQALAH